MTQRDPRHTTRLGGRSRATWVSNHVGLVACVAVLSAVVLTVAVLRTSGVLLDPPAPPAHAHLQPIRYLGVYEPGVPKSYAGIEQFAQAVGRQPTSSPITAPGGKNSRAHLLKLLPVMALPRS